MTPGSGIRIRDGKNPETGSGMNIPDLIFENFAKVFVGLKILKFFDADPGSCQPWIRDGKNWATLINNIIFQLLA